MPTQATILRVFVATTSNMSDENSALEQVVNQINMMNSSKGIRLELIRWDTHAYPGVGIDPQNVINQQIDDDYDIFIGILWTRIGTKTGRAVSGTAEEFNRAYDRYKINSDEMRVMFYFKDAPIPPSEIDPSQLTLVNEFRNSLGEKGVLYWSYTNTDEFEDLVRLHLIRQINEFGRTWSTGIVNKDVTKQVKITGGDVGSVLTKSELSPGVEEGFIDLVLTAIQGFELGTIPLSRITELVENLGNSISTHTDEMNQLPQPVTPKLIKTITDKIADDLEDFAEKLSLEIPVMAREFRSGIQSFSGAAQLLVDFDTTDEEVKTQIEQATDTVTQLRSSMSSAYENIKGFRVILQKIPRMSTKINHAKRHAGDTIDNLLEELDIAVNLSAESEKIMRETLKKMRP